MNRPPVNPALAELWEREGILEDVLSGHGLRFHSVPSPPPQPPQPFIIEPFDTSSFVDPPVEPTNRPAEADEPPPAPTYPAPTTRSTRGRWRRAS